MTRCYHCGCEYADKRPPGRQEICAGCGRDLHVCRNCTFFDTAAYNQCREPQAERVVNKERSNFCDYFRFGHHAFAGDVGSKAGDAKAKLDSLFKGIRDKG